MFEKTLTDVVKGIRASKRDTASYISKCIAEIKEELKSSDLFVKANALQKLTFLQMMGYSMGYASFATIEVMSSPRFSHKRIGYLAASQGFTQDTEVILLTTNLLKKELRGAVGGGMQGVYEAGLAINCISNIVTEDLARDLLPELTNLSSHPQPYLRKKAILCLFKVFVKYPQALRLTFQRLQQSLEDPNSSVVSCAVNVITELSDKNPRNYLHLAPQFFKILTTSSNNWMLIKVVKLLGSLVPEEPRLARKLLDPLAGIVRNTNAKSLLYESVRTITMCLPYCRKENGTMPQNVPEIVELCADTLLDFVQQSDQNLKYLGLVGFGSLMQSHPRVLSDPKYRPLILACLSDPDVTIRRRALDLLTGMTSRKNLMELVSQLLKHVELASGTYKHDLVQKIVEMCSGEKYALLQDFAWYLDILFQLGHMRGIEKHGELLRAQVTDVALRVLPVRPYAVRRSIEILLEGEGDVSDDPYGDNGRGRHMMLQILPAIAWIIGEYSDLIPEASSIDPDESNTVEFSFDDKSRGTYHAIVQCLTTPSNTQNLSTSTQKVYLQAAMKVFAAASADKNVKVTELEACVETIHRFLPVYMQSVDVEVVERSFSALELMKSLGLCAETVGGAPGLLNLNEDDSSDAEREEDLLGMEFGGGAPAPTKQVENKSTGSGKSLASKVRDSSEILNYLLKPAPMKPTGTKAQRKKRQTFSGVDLDSPVNLSVFRDRIEKEEKHRVKSKMTVESVSFTQQRPFQVEEPKPLRPKINTDSVMCGPFSSGVSSDATTSFQHSGQEYQSPGQRQSDPFYLESAPSSDAKDNDRVNPSRFGTIQLLESDDEDDSPGVRRQKKKKKAKKDKAVPETAVYESEDDEEESPGRGSEKKKRTSKEFAGLASVDLTTPLREDEVMPERKHRVVPDRSQLPPQSKNEKKKKKAKKKALKKESVSSEGDLLDLGGGFGDVSIAAPPPSESAIQPTQSASINPINSAFDGLLLDLSAPAPAPGMEDSAKLPPAPSTKYFDLSSREKAVPATKDKAERPWLKATTKSPDGSNSAVDWSHVLVLFRVYRLNEENGVGAMLVICVRNHSQSSLNGLSLDIKGRPSVHFGNVTSMSSAESEKIGPFMYSVPDTTEDIKCTLRTYDSRVSVKIHLPVTLHLTPENRISLEQVAQELSSSEWQSSAAKVDLGAAQRPEEVKLALGAFLRAASVGGGAPNKATGTYAARSIQGSPVRFLVKIKKNSVKVDVRSTSETLCKALATDIKRLVLN